MKRLARILVDRRYLFAAVMLAVTILCAFLALRVEINTDMTRYLPAKSPMRKGRLPTTPSEGLCRMVYERLARADSN